MLEVDDKFNLNLDYESLEKIIRRHLRKNRHLTANKQNTNLWYLHCDGVRTLFYILQHIGLFKVIKKKKKI